MVAQDHVLHQGAQQRRKIGQGAQAVAYHAHGNRNVSDQLAFIRVGKAALVIQLVDFSNVVQNDARGQQVEVDDWIVRRGQAGQAANRQHVFDQSAQKRVMDLLGGGRTAIAAGHVRVV